MAENEKQRIVWAELIRKLTQNSISLWVLIGIVGFGVALLFTGNEKYNTNSKSLSINNQSLSSNSNESSLQNGEVSIEKQLADELAETLSSIEGVGLVKVKVNLRSQSRKIWERQIHTNKRTSQEQGGINTEDETNNELVFAKDRDGYDRPILKEELAPEIEGIIVVAEGAQDIKLKRLLIETVMTVLGVPAHRVIILPGKMQEVAK